MEKVFILETNILEVIKMNKIYLYIMNIETKAKFFKYFETEHEKDKFKRRLKYIPYLMLIEDSSDMNWNYS